MDAHAPSPTAPAAPAPLAAVPFATGAPTSPAPGPVFPPDIADALAAAVLAAARRLAAEDGASAMRPGFIDAKAAAVFLGVSSKVLRNLVKARRVPVVRLTGKTWLFRPAALVEALQRLECPARRVA